MKKQYPNYIRDQKNKLRRILDGQDKSFKRMIESKEKNEKKYGKYPELIKIGEKERLGGHIPQKLDNEEMKKSYEYGYFIRGSRVLAAEFEKGTYSIPEQRIFGIRDLNNGIEEECLLNLTDYPSYINGRIYQMGRNIYDYITENNIQIEEYISLMSLINENFNNPEFKNGYNDKKNEMENINQKRR